MKLTLEQLDELEKAANAAGQGNWDEDELHLNFDDWQFVVSCDPQTVKALIAMAREGLG